MIDRLVIGIDETENKEHTCLIVATKNIRGIEIINEFYDEDAINIYNILTNRNERNSKC